jgi:hypothetical protein
MSRLLARIAALLLLALAMPAMAGEDDPFQPGARNPLIPGSFADPAIIRHKGEWFVFATMDPWGGETLGLWRSRNFRDWKFSTPNWPTKAAATSPTSNKSRVWAPSVVKGQDGRFWMYVSVGSEVWVGVADQPGGPWRDANGGKPLIPGNAKPGYHMIDAEAFVDDDGQAYLYWGSGLNWVNGHCFVVKLKPDMVTFDGEPKDVTPAHYFEAPFMMKRGGHYFLTYSWGNTTKDTYQVRYAVGTSPMGPFVEPEDKALLETDAAKQIISPGHHALFSAGGKDFILYHRQALPFPSADGQVLRQIAVDRLIVQGDHLKTVVPTHEGADVPGTAKARSKGQPFILTSSNGEAGRAADDNYATGWSSTGGSSWLRADAGRNRMIGRSEIRLAAPDKAIRYRLSVSGDGQNWRPVGGVAEAKGSPLILPAVGRGRYARLDFDQPVSILEWSFLP